jgi:hypothetical protein
MTEERISCRESGPVVPHLLALSAVHSVSFSLSFFPHIGSENYHHKLGFTRQYNSRRCGKEEEKKIRKAKKWEDEKRRERDERVREEGEWDENKDGERAASIENGQRRKRRWRKRRARDERGKQRG